MSRFKRLEFGKSASGAVAGVVKDEAFYLTEAKDAFRSGQFEGALRNYAKVLEFNPENVEAWCGQVRALIELGEFLEAKLWADKALERFDTAPEILAAKAVALARFGDCAAALAFSDASVEERGDTPYIWIARGDVLLACGEKRAEYCFQKAFALAPGDWALRWLVSRIHAFYLKFSLALKYAEEALQRTASNAAVWTQAGECQLALGLTIKARSSFSHALQLVPAHGAATRGLEQAFRSGFFQRLRGAYRQLFHG
jgi:tetratricopeptide (TPR) repeat protein